MNLRQNATNLPVNPDPPAIPATFSLFTRRPWSYLIFGFGFVANSVSLLMGGTHPVVPETGLWLGMAWVTAAVCFAFWLFPTVSVYKFTLAQIATSCLVLAAGARAVGAIGWNPQLWSQFGGGSIWTMLTVAFYRMHVVRRSTTCRLHGADHA